MNNTTRILVVDSKPADRQLMSQLIEGLGFTPIEVDTGVQALVVACQVEPNLIIVDADLADINSLELLRQLKTDVKLSHIPALITAARHDVDVIATALELGADDYLIMPINAKLFGARIGNSLGKKQLQDMSEEHAREADARSTELKLQVRQQVAEISAGHIATIFAMSKLAESRDPETGEHLERIRTYSRVLAEVLSHDAKHRSLIDTEYIETIFAASPLHDIGKVGVPDMVLLKPGKLDPDEWELMKTHSAIGSFTLKEVHALYPHNRFVRMGIEIAHSHHEKFDGTGYPNGLAGEDIPLCARILALADVYDALRSPRVYKPPFSHEKAHGIILESSGSHFDPRVVQAYTSVAPQFAEIRTRFDDPEHLKV